MTKRNPVAKSLRTPKFKHKVIQNKKKYNRKKIIEKEELLFIVPKHEHE